MKNELEFHKKTDEHYESKCGTVTIMVSRITRSWTVWHWVGPLQCKREVDSLQAGIEFAQAKMSAQVAA